MNPNYCVKHNRQKVLMITSSFCPQCDSENAQMSTSGNSSNQASKVYTLDDLNGFKKVISEPDYIDDLDWSKGDPLRYPTAQATWELKYGKFRSARKYELSYGSHHRYIAFCGSNDQVIDISNTKVRHSAQPSSHELYYWHPVLLRLFPL